MDSEVFVNNQTFINLTFDFIILKSLIKDGKLHVSDFHCLDQQSKKIVWEMMRVIAVRDV